MRNIGRKDLRELRKVTPVLEKYLACPECPNSPENGGACKGSCPGLELMLASALPGAESIQAERPSNRQTFDDNEEHPPASAVLRDDFDLSIQRELFAGKLTFQAIADLHSCGIEEVVKIKDEALESLQDPVLHAIIEQRLTGKAAADRFHLKKQTISMKKRRALERLRGAKV